jgi:hypothetical protein
MHALTRTVAYRYAEVLCATHRTVPDKRKLVATLRTILPPLRMIVEQRPANLVRDMAAEVKPEQ